MVQKYRLKNLGCAACAAKMEHKISQLDGVKNCNISFMTSRLKIEADEALHPEIREKAGQIVSSIEPDCSIS